MCGWYVRRSDRQKIAEWFHADPNPADLPMSDVDYNVAPTTRHPSEPEDGRAGARSGSLGPGAVFLHQGFEGREGADNPHAHSETITTAPTWREPFKKRRCLLPVSAFCEWPKEGKPPKQSYAFELANGQTFAFAGLWDAWKDNAGHLLKSFAIMTTGSKRDDEPNPPRMPVIPHADYDRWLDRMGQSGCCLSCCDPASRMR